MSLIQRIIFILLTAAVLASLHITTLGVFNRVFPLSHPPLAVLIAVLLAVLMVFGMVLPKIHDNRVTSSLYILSSVWLGFLFLFFSATMLYEAVRLLSGQELSLVYVHFMVFAFLFGVYAVWNSRQIRIVELTLPINNLTEPVRVAHLSDIHIGSVHREGFLRRVVTLTNQGSPDVVLMTGDLFDGSVSIHEEMLAPLDELVAPAFFSTGNHEEYEGLPLVTKTIEHLKMQLLDMNMVEYRGVQIIGIRDRQSLPKEETLSTLLPKINYDEAKPTILMYHTPVEWAEAQAAGIDLMLSGHTHNGQLFPFTLLVRLAFTHVCGLYQKGQQYLHVTPGTGTWGPPMRLGSKNQITFINLEPQPTDGTTNQSEERE